MEIFKQVKGFEGLYEVSNYGTVISFYGKTTKGKKLIPKDNGRGYLRVKLSKNKISKRYMLHRVVAETFLENTFNKSCINHIDGNKKNNVLSNLEWVTHSENKYHAIKLGLINYEKRNWGKKVIDTETKIIYKSIAEAAKICKLDRGYLGQKLKGLVKNNTKFEFL